MSAEQRERLRDTATRQLFNVKTDSEVVAALRAGLAGLGPPIQVVFNTARCADCGAVGDPRLLPRHCHMEAALVHPGRLENFHPGRVESFHPSQQQLREHPGRLQRAWYSNLLCGSLRKPRHTCCHRRAGKEGCQERWACCRRDWTDPAGCSTRFSCCGAAPALSPAGCATRHLCCLARPQQPGCTKVCKKCGEAWGEQTENCFEKEHNIAPVCTAADEEEGEEEKSKICETIMEFKPLTNEKYILDKSGGGRIKKLFDLFDNIPPIITYHMI